ncbi:MAG: M48 family metallopeptidase [Saprospiraceae bacterium]|nr:M48 family metallopeptidase [Saprospiraceae bacterium]
MIRTSGTYFDGISSEPRRMEIAFEEGQGQLDFEFPLSGSSSWHAREVSLERLGMAVHLRIGTAPIPFVKIDDAAFITALYAYLRSRGHLPWYQRMLNLGLPVHLAIAGSLLALVAAVYIYFLPWVGEKSVVLIPEDYDNTFGNSFYEEYIGYSTVDSTKTVDLNLFASHLKLNNTKALNFVVVQDETVNAFALPDGHIVVFTGILEKLRGYEELAGLLSHEAVHVNNRHSMKMLCRNLAGYLFISALLSDVNGIMAIVGENIRSLQSLSYSRQFEKEADMDGLAVLAANKIDPKGMTGLLSRLKAEEGKINVPAFLSSHPITGERLAYIDTRIKSESYVHKEMPVLKEIFERLKK